MNDLVCYIKSEYKLDPAEIAKETEDESKQQDVGSEPPVKKQKKSKKDRGMNKHRPIFREAKEDKLCKSLIHGKRSDNPCSNEKCTFQHDLNVYLDNRAPDIADTCPIYSTKGFCQYGVTCRFSGNHLTEEFQNMGDITAITNNRLHLSFELQNSLRKKKYDFTKADNTLKEVDLIIQQHRTKLDKSEKLNPTDINETDIKEHKIGSVDDTDTIAIRPEEKKKVDFRNKLLLSPLTTLGNLPFRRICKEYGADITCGEMACSIPLLNGALQEWALTKRHESEDVFGVQLCGHNAKTVSYATQLLSDNINIDFIDLNIGCPIDLIYQQGGGSALIRRPNVLEAIVRSCSKLLDCKPFTVKTRTGVYADKNVAHDLIPKMEEWGASAVTLHGRSREQRYTKSADWKYIEECASKVKKIPLIGNGDIMGIEDYNLVKENAPSVSSVMIGRGALIKPWIFKEIKDGKPFDISSRERFEMLQKFVNYGLEHWGSDTKGVETTRRFLLEWQSFLYRYVPYGILERPPQRINQRPENDNYQGRDDVETLMTSYKSSDWIKISEIFLGQVPDGFIFLPKHKANAYNH